MKHFRKIWDQEKNDFIITLKGLKPMEAWLKWHAIYGDIVTYQAFCNQRSRLKAGSKVVESKKKRKAQICEIGTRRFSKGYWEVKISKNKWKAEHIINWEMVNGPKPEGTFLFCLDRNVNNTAAENWECLPMALIPIINRYKPNEYSNPDAIRTIILLAKLKHEVCNMAEENGLMVGTGQSRRFKNQAAEWYRKHKDDPEFKRKISAKRKKVYHEMKENNPVAFQEMLEKRNKKRREKWEWIKVNDPIRYQKIREQLKANSKRYREKKNERKGT